MAATARQRLAGTAMAAVEETAMAAVEGTATAAVEDPASAVTRKAPGALAEVEVRLLFVIGDCKPPVNITLIPTQSSRLLPLNPISYGLLMQC